MSSIHSCKIQCHSISPDKLEQMGLDDDLGIWMPFSFHMDIVIGCKLCTDDDESPLVGCTTLFTEQGDNFIIDTPFSEFNQLFKEYHNESTSSSSSKPTKEVNL